MMTIFEFKRKVIYMQEIKIFEGHEVEVLEFEGQVLFNAKHVAEILDIKNVNDNISRMNEKQVIKLTNSAIGKTDIRKLNNAGENFLTESGVYKLVFKSHKPNAEKFTDWIADEVLPSIRKHGMYATDNVIDNILNNPDFGIELLTRLKEERAARVKAEQRNAVLMHVNKTYTMTEIAKELGLRSAIELNKMLSEMHIQYKINNTWVMYSDYSNLGYEEIKQEVLDNGTVVYHRKITQAGREFIINLVQENKKVG